MKQIELIRDHLLKYYGKVHEVEMGKPEEFLGPRGSYQYHPIRFINSELESTTTAGLYLLPPLTPTRTVLITGDVVCRNVAIKGAAWSLINNPRKWDQGLDTRHLDTHDRQYQIMAEYGEGAVVTFVPTDSGAEVLEISRPRFEEGMKVAADFEDQQEIGGVVVSDPFWADYHRYLRD